MPVLCAIIVFNPDHERLKENILAIKDQVDKLVLYDNGGLDKDILPMGVDILGDASNIGMASAMNSVFEYAQTGGFDRVLTLDQDSVCPPGLIEEYEKGFMEPDVAMISPCISDRNYGSMDYDKGQASVPFEEIDACITSGAMLRVDAWKQVGGFWDELFIDMVDFDMCWTLKEAGFTVMRANNVTLLHEIGHSRRVRFMGKDEVVYNHAPERCYYMTRNSLAVGRKHKRTSQCVRWLIKRSLLINLFEKQRPAKNKMIVKGVADARRFYHGA